VKQGAGAKQIAKLLASFEPLEVGTGQHTPPLLPPLLYPPPFPPPPSSFPHPSSPPSFQAKQSITPFKTIVSGENCHPMNVASVAAFT